MLLGGRDVRTDCDGNGAFVLLPGALGIGLAMRSTLTTLALE